MGDTASSAEPRAAVHKKCTANGVGSVNGSHRQAHLATRDLRAGVEQFTQAIAEETRTAEMQIAQQTQQTAERLQQRRINAVRVIGASTGEPPLLIVEMGQASFEEADPGSASRVKYGFEGRWPDGSFASSVRALPATPVASMNLSAPEAR